ncbi:MAG: glycosyltransferase [Burkholderiaceae bacterium]
MKLVLVYRRQRPDAFSIEELFGAISRELAPQIDVIEYEVGGRSDIARDVLKLRAMRADVYHVTGDINYIAAMLPSGRTVLTVHDIGHYLYSLTGIKRQIYKWLWLLWPMRAAGAVTCVSEETRKSISAHLGLAMNRMVVIENCYSPIFKPVEKSFNSDCPTILQVGTKPYKNVPRLVRALQGFRCRLVLIGKIDRGLAETLAEAGTDFTNYINISHEELARQYAESDVVTFASTGEGLECRS